ncbi:tyrosine-type recombinase/integrase [Thermomonospora umbrina]|uniref:Integrase/recombinase XerC/integrase/recombinase XerD n=1 Tax=Thermomonospora umbrina TaxID=111806 RepID=A0A3D9T214_9ACTN|nr:tyrosine-type recombinase/integrase [Thermomonospora umbrina]REF00891.1 integrase/recombinase XerC/integrase/recombinase XerD [Thermomonospora umbrina]
MDDGTLDRLAERWLDHKRASGRGMSDNTESAYRADLRAWARALAGHHGLDAPDDPDPLTLLRPEHLTERALTAAAAEFFRDGRSAATRGRRISALRGWCAWLVRAGHLAADPTAELETPRLPRRLPVALTDEQLGAVVRAASTPHEHARGQWVSLDRALIALFAGAGPRTSEVVGLRVGDLVRDDGVLLRLRGKGGAHRNVPIDPVAVEPVDDYLADRAARLGAFGEQDPLLVTLAGRAVTTGMIEYRVDRWFRRAGVSRPEGELAHVFRHTYAVGVLREGASLNELQAVLGHQNLATTSVYTKVAAEGLRDVARTAPVLRHLRATRPGPADGGSPASG